ncbi:Transposase IS116/IS110/IS902 family protein [Streptomyces sp. TLI_053]|uniref:IS110 family transposase n=1 Tax=Streptomyces sp. TLI_053 TaxID=1855352 RepID=UPI00087A221C|nr:transposase [Streptomyces sp. TLI_053]SDS57670.1 Transposase IS116/IS110/IS902 family protein [Streptomyces sp. TLI_053]
MWAGVDIGKEHHHCVVINADGERLLSRRVLNGEAELLDPIGDVLAMSTDVLWAVDLNHGGAALLIGLPLGHDQPMACLTGLAVYRASATYKGGKGKTDAKDAFAIADRLAGFACLAPGPRDSGRVSGNLRRPKRYHRGLLRSMHLSAMVSTTTCPTSKACYQRKRAEGKGHKQALLALARRRLNVLWAMIHDGQCYQGSPPVTTAA